MVSVADFAHPDADLDEGDDPTGFYLWRLFIAKDHQRQGYGTAALNFVVDQAKQLGRNTLYTSAVQHPLYTRHLASNLQGASSTGTKTSWSTI